MWKSPMDMKSFWKYGSVKDVKINLLGLFFGKWVANPSILSFQSKQKMATIIRVPTQIKINGD